MKRIKNNLKTKHLLCFLPVLSIILWFYKGQLGLLAGVYVPVFITVMWLQVVFEARLKNFLNNVNAIRTLCVLCVAAGIIYLIPGLKTANWTKILLRINFLSGSFCFLAAIIFRSKSNKEKEGNNE